MYNVITISRQFGSGGRELGRRLAEELGFAYYDDEIIEEISKRTTINEVLAKTGADLIVSKEIRYMEDCDEFC